MPLQSTVEQVVTAELNRRFNTAITPGPSVSPHLVPVIPLGAVDPSTFAINQAQIAVNNGALSASEALWATPLQVAGTYDIKASFSCDNPASAHTWTLEVFNAGGQVTLMHAYRVLVAQNILKETDEFAIILLAGEGVRLINDTTAEANSVNSSVWWRKRLVSS